MSNYANFFRELFSSGQTGAVTGGWVSVPGHTGPSSEPSARSVLVEPYANTWGTCVVAIQTRPKGASDDAITQQFTASANGEGNWLDLTTSHEIRAVITGSGGTNVNVTVTG